MIRLVTLSLAALTMAGCAVVPPQQKDYTAFKQAAPRSLLVVPAINKSLDVQAPYYFLSTISVPLARRGYYVFPVNAVKSVMEQEGMADADMAHKADPRVLAELFGADAVLYVTINRWDAKYALLATSVTVDFDYEIKDGKTGQSLWQEKQAMVYTPQNNSSGNPMADLVAMAITAAITKAAPNYMPLTQQANAIVATKIPEGPYIQNMLK